MIFILFQFGMLDKLEDKDLVKKASKGDKDAYRVLVEKYQSRVYRIAKEIMRNDQDAEDVTQEAFVKAFFALPKLRARALFIRGCIELPIICLLI